MFRNALVELVKEGVEALSGDTIDYGRVEECLFGLSVSEEQLRSTLRTNDVVALLDGGFVLVDRFRPTNDAVTENYRRNQNGGFDFEGLTVPTSPALLRGLKSRTLVTNPTHILFQET